MGSFTAAAIAVAAYLAGFGTGILADRLLTSRVIRDEIARVRAEVDAAKIEADEARAEVAEIEADADRRAEARDA